jgi:hypothetical protein
MTETKGDRAGLGVVSDFGFRYADFQFTHHSELLKQKWQKPKQNL